MLRHSERIRHPHAIPLYCLPRVIAAFPRSAYTQLKRNKVISDLCSLASTILLLLIAAMPMAVFGAQTEKPASIEPNAEITVAPVRVDGVTLFQVRGVSAFPAKRRAKEIAARIAQLAADPKFTTEQLRLLEKQTSTSILAGEMQVMLVVDADAEVENIERKLLSDIYLSRIKEAIAAYRAEREPVSLVQNTAYIIVATIALLVVVWLARRGMRFTSDILDRRLRARIEGLESKSRYIVRARQIWFVLNGVIKLLWIVLFVFVGLWYLQFALGQLPWTRQIGNYLLSLLLNPLQAMSAGLIDAIPDLAFLVILVLVTRYLLKVMHLFFNGLAYGSLKFEGFDAEWAWPTYRLVRMLVIIFALVVAFPYIPGSGSDAFKGISVFLGIVFSLGSSSVIANILAGYSMIYRRAFKIGDRIQVDEHMGDVIEQRLLVTHLRTAKNEVIVVPNSVILNSSVVNFSTLAREGKLVLHTTVGIGYETPWRQVEAMLVQAARQTAGVQSEPVPFVLQKSLGDFCVLYEINVYCDNAQNMNQIYTALHRNILDVFNEYGVQIMTPAYEGDPPEAKIVPKEKWFTAPATSAEK